MRKDLMRESTVSRRAFTVLAVVALVAIPRLASAHGGNNDPNVVHACIGNLTKIVRIVGVSGSCISPAESPTHWGIQGSPGAPGTNGTNGTDGANGTNGIDGTSATFVGYFAGSQNGCPNGGAIFAAGSPAVNAYVCNGTNGTGARAAGPCFDNANRYVDCGNGTVTDTVTGLIWLKQWDCLGTADWAAGSAAAAGLKDGDCAGGLTDGSSPGDWRLPTRLEWEATIAMAVFLNCNLLEDPLVLLTDDAGTGCYGYEASSSSSFPGVTKFDAFWSSTAWDLGPSNAWLAAIDTGVFPNAKTNFIRREVWPVRGGTGVEHGRQPMP
jgi:hypothetical protein